MPNKIRKGLSSLRKSFHEESDLESFSNDLASALVLIRVKNALRKKLKENSDEALEPELLADIEKFSNNYRNWKQLRPSDFVSKGTTDRSQTADQNRIVVMSIIIASAIGVLTIGRQGIENYVGRHFYTSALSGFLAVTPVLSGLFAFFYILAVTTSLKYSDQDFIGNGIYPKLYMVWVREKFYDLSIDLFWMALIVDTTVGGITAIGKVIHNTVAVYILASLFIAGFIAAIGVFNGLSIIRIKGVEKIYHELSAASKNSDDE